MILGQGDLQPALERQAVRLGIAERVIFPGYTTEPLALLRQCRFVRPVVGL